LTSGGGGSSVAGEIVRNMGKRRNYYDEDGRYRGHSSDDDYGFGLNSYGFIFLMWILICCFLGGC
jgi:hypothetical protein